MRPEPRAAVGVPVAAPVREEAQAQAVPLDVAQVLVERDAVGPLGVVVHEALVVDDQAAREQRDAHALALHELVLRGHGLDVEDDVADVLGRVPRQLGEDGVHDLAAAPPLVVHGAVLGLAGRERHVQRRVDVLGLGQPRHPGAVRPGAELRQHPPAVLVAAVERLGVVVDLLVRVLLLLPLEPHPRRRRQDVEHAGRDRRADLEVPRHGEQRVHLLPEGRPGAVRRPARRHAHQHEQRLEDENRLPGQVVHGAPEVLGD